MPILRKSIELITTPPGDLVYHLVTLFAIQLILGIAVGHWNRNRRDLMARRLLIVGVGLTLTRTAMMLVAVLHQVGAIPPNVVQPPLERALDLAVLLLVLWAFLPFSRRYERVGMALLIVTLLLTVGVYGGFAALWSAAEEEGMLYNDYWQSTVWEAISIALLVLGLVVNLIWRDRDWSLIALLLSLWLVGHAFQLLGPSFGDHSAGYFRLSNLAALPLLANLVYRRALSAVSVNGMEAGLNLVGILGAIQRAEAVHDVDSAMRMAAPSIVYALGADIVAIGFPQNDLSKKIRIVALHPSTGTMLAGQAPSLLVSKYPSLAEAIKTGDLQRVDASDESTSVTALYNRLGFGQAGPMLILPLFSQGKLLGVILAGNPISQRRWTLRGEQVFQAVGAAIKRALINAARRESEGDRGAELQRALEGAERLTQEKSELEAELMDQRQRADELSTKLRLREREVAARDGDLDEAAIWHEELHKLTESRAELEAELTNWKDRVEQLTQSKEDLLARLEAAQAALEEVQAQAGEGPALTAQLLQGKVDPHGILISDEEGHVILASQGAQQLVGQVRSVIEGTPLDSLFDDPAWEETVQALFSEEAQSETPAVVILDLNGEKVRAELNRIPDIDGAMGSLAVMLYPDTEVVTGALSDQEETLIARIHELRTPMTSITGYTNLLLDESMGILGETQRQLLKRINVNIERMGGMLEDLFRFVALDAREASLSPESVEVTHVVQEAVAATSGQISERELDVQVDVPPHLPSLSVDRDSFYQIMLHLLSNACESSRPGSTVKIGARLESYERQVQDLPDYLLISVTDTGGGIAPEDQHRIFQRLYRADNPQIVGLGDNGIGLPIARALVEALGGRIWVESEMGVGSTFSFILPLTPEQGTEGNDGQRVVS